MTGPTRCPACGLQNSLIIDSRYYSDGFYRRRRECQSCGERWSTMEVPFDTGQKLIKIIKLIKEIDI